MPENVGSTMEIIYTKHAVERIKLRKINKKDVENAIAKPSKIIDKNDIKICQKPLGNKILRVVYRLQDNTYIVITAYLTTKRKYMSGD